MVVGKLSHPGEWGLVSKGLEYGLSKPRLFKIVYSHNLPRLKPSPKDSEDILISETTGVTGVDVLKDDSRLVIEWEK